VNLGRTLGIAMVDLRTAWRRPLWIMLLILLALFAFGFAVGGLRVQAGDVTAGGKQAWINSQFNVAFCDGAVLSLFIPFFAAIAEICSKDGRRGILPLEEAIPGEVGKNRGS
jgi:prepilin-type processing-associated H-X9-DG protein